MYYKQITNVNYYSSVISKFGASLTDNARVVIYDRRMFIVRVTSLPLAKPEIFVPGANVTKLFTVVIYKFSC